MQALHSMHWQTSRELTKEQQAVYFDSTAPAAVHHNTLKEHFGGSQATAHFFANKRIVDIIIGEMLFHPDDSNKDVTKEWALEIFENVIGLFIRLQPADRRLLSYDYQESCLVTARC
jgi:hypothetical protein